MVKEFVEKTGLECLEWPGNSPDLNPIENFWGEMSKEIARNRPKSKTELQVTITQIWESYLNTNYLNQLYGSMPRRCEAVRKAKGGHTKY